MQADLLTSKDGRSYFINCRSNKELLEVGAVYIAPSTSSPLELVGEGGVSLLVEISEKGRDQSVEVVAADTTFYII